MSTPSLPLAATSAARSVATSDTERRGFHYQPAARRLSITLEQAEQEPALDALHFAIDPAPCNHASTSAEEVRRRDA